MCFFWGKLRYLKFHWVYSGYYLFWYYALYSVIKEFFLAQSLSQGGPKPAGEVRDYSHGSFSCFLLSQYPTTKAAGASLTERIIKGFARVNFVVEN